MIAKPAGQGVAGAMTPDLINDAPAIVRPAHNPILADRLHGLMSEAQTFGRKTIEQKVACGRKLIEAKHELAIRNESAASPKDRLRWSKVLKRFGFNERTARRLMTAARSHSRPDNLTAPMEAIYDDGIDPGCADGKKPCRDCRIRGNQFNQKCVSCRALNRPTPRHKDDSPPKDEDGNPIPEHLIPVFNEGQIIRELTGYLPTATKALTGLVERPGCSALRVDEIEKRLRSLSAYAWKYRPGYVHLDCEGKGCKACDGRGWLTVMKVADERAALANEKKRQRSKEWYERQRSANGPIPE
jgi:hypothetical protein